MACSRSLHRSPLQQVIPQRAFAGSSVAEGRGFCFVYPCYHFLVPTGYFGFSLVNCSDLLFLSTSTTTCHYLLPTTYLIFILLQACLDWDVHEFLETLAKDRMICPDLWPARWHSSLDPSTTTTITTTAAATDITIPYCRCYCYCHCHCHCYCYGFGALGLWGFGNWNRN